MSYHKLKKLAQQLSLYEDRVKDLEHYIRHGELLGQWPKGSQDAIKQLALEEVRGLRMEMARITQEATSTNGCH